ncbi:hypothetical protein ACR2VI_28140, partial [Klebsiella pneumoniae]
MKMPPRTMCIAFNGPPGIGKDTLADMLLQAAEGQVYRGTLATLIRRMAADHYKMPEFPTLSTDRATKDSFHAGFPQ